MRKFASNLIFKLISQGGVTLFSALVVFLLARQLGPSEFGLYSLAFAFTSLFVILVNLGMDTIVTREIARHVDLNSESLSRGKADKFPLVSILSADAISPETMRTANVVKFSAAAVMIASVHVVSYWYPFAREHRLLVDLLAVVVVSYGLIDFVGATLAGREEMGWEALQRISSRGVIAVVGIAVLFATQSLTSVIFAMSIASLVSLGISLWIQWRRFGVFPFGWNRRLAKWLFNSSLPLVGWVVFWILYDNQDPLLLNYFHVSVKEIGLFGAAAKIIDVFKGAPTILASAFFPALCRSAHDEPIFRKHARSLFVCVAPVAALLVGGGLLLAPWIVTTLYTHQYVEAVPLFRILLVAFLAVFLNLICHYLLIAKQCERRLLVGAIMACLSKLLLNAWLIPHYGAQGACYSLIGSAFIYLIFQLRILSQVVPGLFRDSTI